MAINTSGVTMRDVARVAGVSVKTVSNVINGYRYLRPETKARVQAAIDSLGYRVNVTARNLRQGRTGLIKLAIPDLRNPYFAQLAALIIEEAAERSLTVLLEQYHGDRDAEMAVLQNDNESFVDGVVFSPIVVGQDQLELFKVRFPLVILGESVFGAPCDHVTMRNIEGAKAQVEHLLAIGRRHIAVIGLNDDHLSVSSALLRFKGVTNAMVAAGVKLDPALVAGNAPWTRPGGAQLMDDILDRGIPIDAVVCFNDALALGAMSTLIERGLSVPDDVAVIGFDNVEDAAFTRPTLSSIDPGGHQIAHTAVKLLCERMGLVDGFDHDTPAREIFTDFKLIPRQSTIGT